MKTKVFLKDFVRVCLWLEVDLRINVYVSKNHPDDLLFGCWGAYTWNDN